MSDLRRTYLHAVPTLAAVVVAAGTVVLGERVTDPLVTGSAPGGGPREMGLVALTLLSGALAVGLGFGLLTLAHRVGGGSMAGVLTSLSSGLAGLFAGLHVVTLVANTGAGAADGLPAWMLAVAFAVALVLGALGWLARPRGEVARELLPVDQLDVVPGEAVVWSGSGHAGDWRFQVPGMVGVAGLLLFLGVQGAWAAVGVGLLAGFLAFSMLRVRVTVGAAGLRVRQGPFGVLRCDVPLSQVTGVDAEVVDPMRYGGWGYRVVPGARAHVVRSGPGLRVRRVDGPDVVVTVDDAQRGAGVLRAHLEGARV